MGKKSLIGSLKKIPLTGASSAKAKAFRRKLAYQKKMKYIKRHPKKSVGLTPTEIAAAFDLAATDTIRIRRTVKPGQNDIVPNSSPCSSRSNSPPLSDTATNNELIHQLGSLLGKVPIPKMIHNNRWDLLKYESQSTYHQQNPKTDDLVEMSVYNYCIRNNMDPTNEKCVANAIRSHLNELKSSRFYSKLQVDNLIRLMHDLMSNYNEGAVAVAKSLIDPSTKLKRSIDEMLHVELINLVRTQIYKQIASLKSRFDLELKAYNEENEKKTDILYHMENDNIAGIVACLAAERCNWLVGHIAIVFQYNIEANANNPEYELWQLLNGLIDIKQWKLAAPEDTADQIKAYLSYNKNLIFTKLKNLITFYEL